MAALCVCVCVCVSVSTDSTRCGSRHGCSLCVCVFVAVQLSGFAGEGLDLGVEAKDALGEDTAAILRFTQTTGSQTSVRSISIPSL